MPFRVRWPNPLVDPGLGPCMVAWQNSFILLGGNGYVKGVQTFDHVEQKWSDLVSETPFSLWYAGIIHEFSYFVLNC